MNGFTKENNDGGDYRKPYERKPKAVHFGAGNIGRGFVGLFLTKSDYDICFVTRNKKKVAQLKQRQEYPVYIANKTKDKLIVQNVTAIHSQNKKAVARQIAEADLVTTAVGVTNLPTLSKKIALGILLKLQSNQTKPLHIIACENAIRASTLLKKSVYEQIPKHLHEKVDSYVAFPDTAVDRIVPAKQHDDPLAVTVEPYFEWIIDCSQILSGLPNIKDAQLVHSLEAYVERKLFTVNTGHCIAAYFGYLKDYLTIQEAMNDHDLVQEVKKTMQETGKMLIEKYEFTEAEHLTYIDKILDRFNNPYLTDEVTRVGRSPLRKLSINDRLVRPTLLTHDLGLDVSSLTKGIAAALLFDYDQDPEAVKLKQAIRKKDIHHVITTYLGIPKSHPLHLKISEHYHEFKEKYQLVQEA